MAKYSIEDSTLTNIANAIRAKTGSAATLTPTAMVEALNGIPTQAAKTVTPSTTDQTAVAKGVFTTGAVTVKGDANLKAENIAEGVGIFGVVGTHSGGGGGTHKVRVVNGAGEYGAEVFDEASGGFVALEDDDLEVEVLDILRVRNTVKLMSLLYGIIELKGGGSISIANDFGLVGGRHDPSWAYLDLKQAATATSVQFSGTWDEVDYIELFVEPD